MNDWYLLLTPLFVLAVMMLLGFVGCGIDQPGRGVPPATTPPSILRIELSFGTEWTLESSRIWVESPDGSRGTRVWQIDTPIPGEDVRFEELVLPDPATGRWLLWWQIKIRENNNEKTNVGMGEFPMLSFEIDEPGQWVVRLQGSGTRSTFAVELTGPEVWVPR
jgi:hypothetical protein